MSQGLLTLLDVTRLVEQDEEIAIIELCQKVLAAPLPVAAVCVYPEWVALAREILDDSPIGLATVINFPAGDLSLAALKETLFMVLNDGATELDVVIDYRAYKEGRSSDNVALIKAIKTIAGDALVKVIIESGELTTPAFITQACEDALLGGADFIKTSTGKVPIGATPEAVQVILATLKACPRTVGLKISGGIRSIAQAQSYIDLITKNMGADFIHPKTFRIGASALFDELLQADPE